VGSSGISNRENTTKLDAIITRDPDILGGTPVFTGTRIPVASLISHLKSGVSLEEFLEDFPSVRREQAEAFLEMAGKVLIDDARAA